MASTKHNAMAMAASAKSEARKSSIAVVGSGISGLSAAWLLQRSGKWDVTLYEARSRFGGHSLTDTTVEPPVDLGFQVFNLTTYAHLQGFFRELGVETEPSDMSFSLSVNEGSLEWASHSPATVFAQRCNIASPSFLRMVAEIIRFKGAIEVLSENDPSNYFASMSTGEYLKYRLYSDFFVANYIAPMTAAVWSCSTSSMLDFPIRSLVRFWKNHHLIDGLGTKPIWRVCKNRSCDYVQKVVSKLKDARSSTAVTQVKFPGHDGNSGVHLLLRVGDHVEEARHDAVLFACHSDTALSILEGRFHTDDSDQKFSQVATQTEKEILGAIKYGTSEVYLHSDSSLMPRKRSCWASWNVLSRSPNECDDAARANSERPVECTYWLNRLQHLPVDNRGRHRFCTLNPVTPPGQDHIIRRLELSHPLFNEAAVRAQSRLGEIQGSHEGRVYFCGAWCGYGFHEDGIRSAVSVCTKYLGVKSIPWGLTTNKIQAPSTPTPEKSWMESICMHLFNRMARSAFDAQGSSLRLILPDGTEHWYGDPKLVQQREARDFSNNTPTIRILDWRFFTLVCTRSDIGLGEAFMHGYWEAGVRNPTHESFKAVLCVLKSLVANAKKVSASQSSQILSWLGGKIAAAAHAARANTLSGSSKNIKEHYDLGNAMYKLFLSEDMTYSSGVYRSPTDTLYQAQMNKLDNIIRNAKLRATDDVLEVGCGWGSLAIRAATKIGCRILGITLSEEQLSEAKQRVQKAGLEDKITLVLKDYRHVTKDYGRRFDKILSIEMLEAVGHEFLGTFFATTGRLLKGKDENPDARVSLQVISMPDERYDEYVSSSDFIREHIFPGGHLPCRASIEEALLKGDDGRNTGLIVHSCDDIGLSYAKTLEAWRVNFVRSHDHIIQLGYSEEFFRKWIFYFTYCQAGFEAKYIHTWQLVFTKDGLADENATTYKGDAEAMASSFRTRAKVVTSTDKSANVSNYLFTLPIQVFVTLIVTIWSILTSCREMFKNVQLCKRKMIKRNTTGKQYEVGNGGKMD